MFKQPCNALGSSQSCSASYIRPSVQHKSSTTGLAYLFKQISLMIDIRQERRSLDELTREQLSDIGIDDEQARKESRRAYWDIPAPRQPWN
ncbi:hypothetical protein O4H49_01525 [Kiloniella laminariae]|uniref:DUF1127 domain-containing protein n=1 Tax=Kiloniella laminariae TaxID=454162 RepID=A0ABT4LEB0_9PROT|nr:hypothetical protein [Kiloniella laminariae]MCZ4279437.1 hypothetical protein [Kiloniella laminariae]